MSTPKGILRILDYELDQAIAVANREAEWLHDEPTYPRDEYSEARAKVVAIEERQAPLRVKIAQ